MVEAIHREAAEPPRALRKGGKARERLEETMEEILLDTNEMEWETMGGYPAGTMVKILRDEGEVRTLLMKIPPGFHMDPHSHTTTEQHLILEGGYETSGWKFGPGTYHYLPARRLHGPYDSKDGAVVLVIWQKQD